MYSPERQSLFKSHRHSRWFTSIEIIQANITVRIPGTTSTYLPACRLRRCQGKGLPYQGSQEHGSVLGSGLHIGRRIDEVNQAAHAMDSRVDLLVRLEEHDGTIVDCDLDLTVLQLQHEFVDLSRLTCQGIAVHACSTEQVIISYSGSNVLWEICKALGFWTLIWRMVRPPWTTPAGSSGAPGLASDSCVARGAISRCRLS